MIAKKDMNKIGPYLYEIPKSARQDMRVPARIYADDRLLEMALSDRSVEQLVNTSTLPGIVRYALAMPDVHEGYGFPIGGVAATLLPEGVISPGGVGYDINCGVRLLTTTWEAKAIKPHMADLMTALFRNVPTGVGSSGALRLSASEMRTLLEKGTTWAVNKGYGSAKDREHTEDQGQMDVADASAVSEKAIERGHDEVGTLGSGNHFLEVDEIAEVYDQKAAEVLGLVPGRVCVWIHCGSRGLGHQVCTDAVRAMQQVSTKYKLNLPDRELACAPLNSPEGRQYLAAMACAANYAWANRQVITHLVRQTFQQVLTRHLGDGELRLLYDVCHNIAKIERYMIEGKMRELCVHRKGATRAYGPGRSEIPATYRALGQPVLIPGNMGTGSYILVGTTRAMEDTFGSCCHGAGRVASRSQARRTIRGDKLKSDLEHEGITIRAGSMSSLAEEAPAAYKDLERVVDVVHQSGIAHKVARTRPLGVMKG